MAGLTASDTGPLIALAKIDRLHILTDIFDAVLIPPAVEYELMAKSSAETTRLSRALGTILHVTSLEDSPASTLPESRRLGIGESQALSLAHERKIPIIIDEYLGRKAARRLSVKTWGTIALLLRAKEMGVIKLVAPELVLLRQHGYWLSDTLIQNAIHLAGESVTPDSTT